eukprot:CAMPEP_0197191534 /NCGR_PEP_ID=MMETSP1423-20130617/23559_1 /TAXON_ID=476441 /ORGANISM="Pseudo-nitzschia heimii, Strain UNC1101" /LENGTH=604 /DNA_ID=CAMNT_0042644203 /DNA_START=114 /DNA_END=1925 /DNA_ORIENTATION=+
METSRSPTYAAVRLREDYGTSSGMSKTNDVEASPSYSAAASPHWNGPIEKPAGFSPFVAFCFTINYILGAGFLTLPWAFVQSGLVLSSIMLIVSAVGSDIAKNYMLETMSRAEAMLDSKMHWIKVDKKAGKRLLLRPPAKLERERLLQTQAQSANTTPKRPSSYKNELGGNEENDCEGPKGFQKSASSQSLHDALSGTNTHDAAEIFDRREVVVIKPKKYIVKDRKFEMNALCRVFLGKRGLHAFTLILSLYMCGTLWAYTSVFSSALARAFPIFSETDNGGIDNIFHLDLTMGESPESLNYNFYAIVFACIVVPLSCLELDEQVPLQVVLTACRFLMFFLMIGTAQICAVDMAEIRALKTVMNATNPEFQDMNFDNNIENFRWSGIQKTLPILIFANIYHHSIPGLSHPAADKGKIGTVFVATNAFTTISYLILALTLASAFGPRIEQSSNLNWGFFHAKTGQVDSQGNVVGAAWWTKAISMYIVLFPAIDVVSAFPLNAITLGNNLFGAAYSKNIHKVENNRWLRTAFRLLASVPPIIFGVLVRELGVITDYTGTMGFMIGLTFPAILYVASRRMARRRRFALDTFYTSYCSKIPIATFVIW